MLFIHEFLLFPPILLLFRDFRFNCAEIKFL